MITPHGGKLIDQIARGEERYELQVKSEEWPSISLNYYDLVEVENIATGLYSPLTGFMKKKDYEQVLKEMRLSNGEVWSLPIVLGVKSREASLLELGDKVALKDIKGELYGVLELEDKYPYDKKREAELVYKTTDNRHPGVARLYERGEILLGGRITLLKRLSYQKFNEYRKDPSEVRQEFKKRGWQTIVGFQTRNPIHRAHEYLQKCALEISDGLFLSPLVGETKNTDIQAEYRIKSYEVVMDKIYPRNRIMMTVFPANMHYAGPREAIFHAICRKNYGCTHFIVGRDHAGVGDYYGTYEAQQIFDNFTPEEIGITPLKFEYAFYCRSCEAMATTKTCPHNQDNHVSLSGTKIRKLLREGKRPPVEMTRPEVVDVLIEAMICSKSKFI